MAPTPPSTVWLIFLAKAARTFCYGYLAVVLPLHLAALGLGAGAIGLAVAGTLGASALLTFVIGRPAERLGSRAVLVGLAGLCLVAGALLATARTPALVVLAAMLGNVALSGSDSGPFMSIEQVLVSRAVAREGLTLRMSLYFLVALVASALGALVVAAVPAGEGYRLLFWLFALSGGVQALLYARLPATAARAPLAAPRQLPSRGFIYRIAGLFALDSFAGGFVLQSLLAYWLHVRFALTPAEIGAAFFAQQLLAACSLLIAARTARRLGLVNTMVFSHLASNGLLIAMGFAPTPALAVGLLLARALLSQMDIPTRQTFLMLVVQDDEREAAATVTNAGRTVAQALSPALTGYVMQAVSLSAPFVLGGVLKIVYDLLLYDACRRRIPVSARGRAD
jgi:MFS family permease